MDPRRILEEAAQHRQACQIQVRGERWIKGQVVRVERGGLVITSDERRFIGGEDLRVWLTFEMKQYTFQASVIRAGVPIPERNQDGLLLGFIDNWAESASESNTKEGYVVELVPANGPAISLLDAPVRLVELVVDGLSFTVPDDFKLIFVESGTVTVRIQAPGIDSLNIHARVGALSAGEGYRLYGLEFEKVEDPENHRKVVDQLGQR
ncbi:MAG: hypothetical protein CL930_03270 [Deltaproteobacteria bacterium]|nr:hypothetical protein [Deltaproteobacteria bacterium]